ncbi:MAG TPA: DoxX family protein, partial [Bradyrhizobium sp.]|nr:DoxX family protein [Bradyrhizobium sp.]
MSCIPDWLIALAARVFPAAVFWQSGQTKVAGFHLKPSAIALFQNEYQLPLIDPAIAAHISAFSEHFFPILLVIGLATRFSALALLLMTA